MTEVKLLFDIPYQQLEKNNLSKAFVTKYNGKWYETSTQEYLDKANALSKVLLDLGIKPNDKIAIITDRNRVEWHITDIGLMQIGVQSVPVYDSTNQNDLIYIFNHAEVKFCFVATEKLYHKINEIAEKIPTLTKIISFDSLDYCSSLEDLIKTGIDLENEDKVDSIKKTIKPDDLATIIYTSGTTDKPKGVMLSHHNIISNIIASQPVLPKIKEPVKTLSFLPVSHIFERMILYIYQYSGYSIYFAESMETISLDIVTVKPHIVTVVPRVLEKIYAKILEKGTSLSYIKRNIFDWALKIGSKFKPYGQNGKSYERDLTRARFLVFSKWQEALGGNIKAIICGSSKLDLNIVRIFNAANIPVFDGYGLTETAPVISANSPNGNGLRIGSIGKPIDNVEVIIGKDGEILAKGPNIMLGYYKDDKKTRSSFINGYLRTGDIGKIDEDGFLYITGRKNEMFKTSNGKYINPSKIENELRKSLYIEQAMVIGKGEKVLAAIIQPNFEWIKTWLKSKETDYLEWIKNTAVLEKIQTEINLVNNNLEQWEKIHQFELTPEEWSIEAGHLTPTLKVKRDIIKSKYYILYNKIYRPLM